MTPRQPALDDGGGTTLGATPSIAQMGAGHEGIRLLEARGEGGTIELGALPAS